MHITDEALLQSGDLEDSGVRAFADHGDPSRRFDESVARAEQTLHRADAAGIDLDAVTDELEREGMRTFCDSYQELLDCIETKLERTISTT